MCRQATTTTRTALSVRLCHPGLRGRRADVAQPLTLSSDVSRGRRRAVRRGRRARCVVVLVDAWTAYGGSQFVDSPGTGRYHSYLCDEVVPFVDGRYRTLTSAAHRGIAGKSSGGFGAMITPMLRPDLFGGLASHAGDALYELLHSGLRQGRSCAARLRRVVREVLGGLHVAPADEQGDRRRSRHHLRGRGSVLGRRGRHRAPAVRPADGTARRRRLGALARLGSRAHGPRARRALRSLRAIYLDGGTRDEWYLDLGALAFRDALAQIGVTDVACELFDAAHGGIDYRYPRGLAYLAERLSSDT